MSGAQGERPDGAGAVMASRARGEVAGDDAQAALWRKLEFFPTPPWAARAGGELIKRLDPEAKTCWEPACGQGHMAHGLADYFDPVLATDIHDHGWAGQQGVCDFLHPNLESHGVDWIITNPPFTKAAEFVEVGLLQARRGVAILARTGLFESEGREGLFFGGRPASCKASFFRRVPMHLGRWLPGGGTATGYAWYVWMQPSAQPSWLSAVQELLLREVRWAGIPDFGIPYRIREQLEHPDDARLFGARPSGPDLFGGAHE